MAAVHELACAPLDVSCVQVRVGRGKFETITCPLLLASECQAPYSLEVETRYTPKPTFAGGSDPRKHLTAQLEVPAEAAQSLSELDAAVCKASAAAGDWQPLVSEREGRYTVKVRVVVEGTRPATFRMGDGELQEAAWPALSRELDAHGCFRGAGMSVALRPAYVWAVSGRRGLSLICEQFVAQPSAANISIDYFA
jgi:hypothetical protein